MARDGPPVKRLFRDVARDALDAERERRRDRGEYGSFWDVAKEMQKRATRARARMARARRAREIAAGVLR